MDIALFADRAVLPGLHVTLSSALKTWAGPKGPTFHLFHSNLRERDVRRLKQTLDLVKKRYDLHVSRFEPARFNTLPGMHGSHIIYGRLLLPELLPAAERILYLDSDLLVCEDLYKLAQTNLNGFVLAAVRHCSFAWSLESEFCEEMKFDPNAPNFNSGVLLLDGPKWRSEKRSEECLRFAKKLGGRLWGDQTVINCVCYGAILALDPRWNVIVDPDDPPISGLESGICHFLGAPKPFDLFGDFLHKNYHLFQRALDQTTLRGWNCYSPASLLRLKRNILLGPTIVRRLRARITGRFKRLGGALPS